MSMEFAAGRVGRVVAVVGLGGGLLLTAPATALASTPITFELTGTFAEGVQVSYFGADDEPETAVVSLPWSTAYDYNGSAPSLSFSGVHPGGDPGSVTCRVSVGGRTVVSKTNNAPKSAGTGAWCNMVNMGSGYRGTSG